MIANAADLPTQIAGAAAVADYKAFGLQNTPNIQISANRQDRHGDRTAASTGNTVAAFAIIRYISAFGADGKVCTGQIRKRRRGTAVNG